MKLRGLAVLKLRNPERFKEIVRAGGKRTQELGRAHRFTPEEARAAAKKRKYEHKPGWFAPPEGWEGPQQ